jgi:hypothetical protein
MAHREKVSPPPYAASYSGFPSAICVCLRCECHPMGLLKELLTLIICSVRRVSLLSAPTGAGSAILLRHYAAASKSANDEHGFVRSLFHGRINESMVCRLLLHPEMIHLTRLLVDISFSQR